MQFRYSVADLHAFFPESKLVGQTDSDLTGIAPLDEARSGDISFLGNTRYLASVPNCSASLILLPDGYDGKPKTNQVFLHLKDPSAALAYICERIEQKMRPLPEPGVHPTAIVDQTADIHESVCVGPYCVIGKDVVVGARTQLSAFVTVEANASIGVNCILKPYVRIADNCRIGDRVLLHSGCVVGSDGFGYRQEGSPPDLRHIKIPQVGIVVIEDDVEIGANSTIDRARFGETRIGVGTKIDNLVHIAHNCRIGRHCIIIAQVGISGSVILEDYVVMWGQAGTVGHITLGEGSFVGAQAGVSKSIPPGAKVTGTPAFELNQRRRMEVLERKLPDLFKRVANLEELSGNRSTPEPDA